MVPRQRLLEYLTATYDRRERPVTVEEIATRFDIPREQAVDSLGTFADCELVVAVGGDAYRPTVTARELLALDLPDGEFVVVDAGNGDASS